MFEKQVFSTHPCQFRFSREQGTRHEWMTDQGVHRQVLELGMPMAVAMCLLETDVARVFTDAGITVIQVYSSLFAFRAIML